MKRLGYLTAFGIYFAVFIFACFMGAGFFFWILSGFSQEFFSEWMRSINAVIGFCIFLALFVIVTNPKIEINKNRNRRNERSN